MLWGKEEVLIPSVVLAFLLFHDGFFSQVFHQRNRITRRRSTMALDSLAEVVVDVLHGLAAGAEGDFGQHTWLEIGRPQEATYRKR